jgi:hypothetical protein
MAEPRPAQPAAIIDLEKWAQNKGRRTVTQLAQHEPLDLALPYNVVLRELPESERSEPIAAQQDLDPWHSPNGDENGHLCEAYLKGFGISEQSP